MNPLLRPEFILLRLKQGDLPLEGYTVMFQLVAHTTSYPDYALCAFYDASLNAGPRADFAANKPSFPACCMENLASATPDPETSQPPPRHAEHEPEPEPEPEPTADGSHNISVTKEPSPTGATEQEIAAEQEECTSDQVREPTTMPATDAEDSTTHCTAAEGELNMDMGHNVMDLNMELSACSGSSVSPRIFGSPSPPRALPPPAPPPLSSTMAPPSIGSTVGFHLGCGLGFTWLLLLQPLPVTSLASPSVITSMDIPPSPWTPSFALLLRVRPLLKPPPKTLMRLPGEGGDVTPLDSLVGFSHHLPCSSVCFGFSLIESPTFR
ncbi:hypothetical protein M9458_050674 [Cirrhinus mrigala]|uniref:Uncharacterized protein n=1 Tax=Cirrhinus mrigala TaxID=683832 RepID=A0ABD0MWV4_CIRMR